MTQLRLLCADYCLGLALWFAGDHWSITTLLKFGELAASIRNDMK